MRRSSRSRRAVWLVGTYCVLCALSGCSFLADEFGWYDRAPLRTFADDAPAGTVDHP